MIHVKGAVIRNLKTLADRSIVVTIDFGELAKLGEFEDLIQMPLQVVLAPYDRADEEVNLSDEAES